MSTVIRGWMYGIGVAVLLVLDRIVKYEVVRRCLYPCRLNEYLQCTMVFNRGTSWGLFHSQSNAIFWLVTVGVIALTGAVIGYAVLRMRAGYMILGETLVLAGSLSNIIDRLWYGGVLDFIEFSYQGWVWPVFNGADVLIVIGVFFMMVEQYTT